MKSNTAKFNSKSHKMSVTLTKDITNGYKAYVFTGTHSTGKTTILDALGESDLYTGYKFHRSLTRDKVDGKQRKVNFEVTDESQRRLLEDAWQYRQDNVIDSNSFHDRCIIDTYAYTLYFHSLGLVSEKTVQYAEWIVNELKDAYAHIFYFKTEFDLVEDGVRVQDDDYRAEVEKYIEMILDTYNFKYTRITGTVEERLKQIEGVLGE